MKKTLNQVWGWQCVQRNASVWVLAVLAVGFTWDAAAAQVIRFNSVVPGDRAVTVTWSKHPGDTLTTAQRELIPGKQFAGYQIWRSQTGDPSDFQLLRTYSLLDTTWTFRASERVFVDSDSIIARGTGRTPDREEGERLPGPFNGFAYWYAITWFDATVDTSVIPPVVTNFNVQTLAEGAETDPVYPSKPPVVSTPLLGSVHVVPNPFRADQITQSFPTGNRIQFVNLPTPADVDVYTASGDKVRSLHHEEADGSLDWDLKNADGRDVSSGVYIYYVRSTTGETATGRFVVIR